MPALVLTAPPCGRILDSLLSALPPVQAVTLLTAAARTEAGARLVAALGGLARLVTALEVRHVGQHCRELVAALLRTYDSPESAVRKASVNCLVNTTLLCVFTRASKSSIRILSEGS